MPAPALVLALGLLASPPAPAPGASDLSSAHRLVALLDYVVADYPAAVEAGRITNQAEHLEHRSLLAEGRRIAAALGAVDPRVHEQLQNLLGGLERDVAGLAPAGTVAAAGRAARELVVAGWKLSTFPRSSPDLARGRALFRHNCAPCHGEDGTASTELARKLNPPPRRFDAEEFTASLSPHRVLNTVSFGIPGTAMPSFGENVPETDRWAIAFYVLSLRHRPPGPQAAQEFARAGLSPALSDLAVASDGELLERARGAGLDDAAATAALAYARSVAPALPPESPLDLARRLLGESLAGAREGRRDDAARLALDSYLRGVEPAEGVLRGSRPRLAAAIESGFVVYREALRSGRDTGEVQALGRDLDRLLVEAQGAASGGERRAGFAFLGALAIVLREGVEAALVIGAMLAVLRRAAPDRPQLARSVHRGWASALLAGIATWAAAETVLDLGAAEREAAEGVIALLASALLFTASYWLLANREVARWMGFLSRQVERAGRAGSGSLFALSFLAAYREMFETVLFLQALLLEAEGERLAAAGGIVVAVVGLLGFIRVLQRAGARLPLKPFFALSSLLLGVLSFVLAGEGIHALQQAGKLPAPAVAVPALPTLGIHPTLPGIAAQGTILVLFAAASLWTFVLAPRRPRVTSRA